MAIPTFVSEVAFGSDPDDPTPTWVADISPNVGAISFSRGKNEALDRIEAGTGSLLLLDDEGDFDPRNQASAYYPDVRPMVPIRMYATLAAVDYPLFQHFVEDMPRQRNAGLVTRSLRTVDGFAVLATSDLAGLDLAAGGTGAQIDDILDFVGWPAALRVIATGSASLIGQTFGDADNTAALSYLQDIASNEAGLLFMDGLGRVVFLGRGDLLGPPFNEIQAHFSDDASDGQFVYADSVPYYSADRVFNDWTGTRPGGEPQNAQDATSIGRYRRRSKSVSTLLPFDTDVLNTMQYYLAHYQEPAERLQSITLIPGEDSAFWTTVLTLELGDRISVTETLPYTGKRADDYLIESMTFTRGAGSDAGARVTYALLPTDIPGTSTVGLVLDDAVLGLMDSNGLGF